MSFSIIGLAVIVLLIVVVVGAFVLLFSRKKDE